MRGSEPLAHLEGLSLRSEEGRLRVRVERMQLSATSSARFSAVQADLTPSTAEASTRVEVHLDLGIAEVGHELRIRVPRLGLLSRSNPRSRLGRMTVSWGLGTGDWGGRTLDCGLRGVGWGLGAWGR